MTRLTTRILEASIFSACTRRPKNTNNSDSDDSRPRNEPTHKTVKTDDSGRFTDYEQIQQKNSILQKEKNDYKREIDRLTRLNRKLESENQIYRKTMLEGKAQNNISNVFRTEKK